MISGGVEESIEARIRCGWKKFREPLHERMAGGYRNVGKLQ